MPDYNHLDNTTWCSMAWVHQFIDPQGRVKPCCRFNMPKEIEQENNLNKQSLGDIFYGNFMNDVRQKMINNQEVPGCVRCYQEEASGKKSLRERYNHMSDLLPNTLIEDLNDPTIRWIELAISNDCNLACRMCDSRYAWKWFDDEKELYGITKSKDKFTKSDISSIDNFLDKIVHIKFTGGEPLIIPDHFKLLDKLSQQENVSDIYLNYSTNLTIVPKQDTIDKWKKFKYIEFACSFDGIGPTWELVRYPSKWETAEKVMQNFLKMTNDFDCRVGLRSSISLNNILNMPEAFDWWIKNWNEYASTPFSEDNWINPTHVTFPNYLSTTVLPLKYKDIVAKKLDSRKNDFGNVISNSLESQINYMYSKDDTYLMPELKQYTLHFDNKRKQDFFIANPELIGLFDGI
jgi:MoaA/NifB/PqqE/SkfB family radical SAM enzyme